MRPVDPDLARRNRVVVAERTGWPAGAVETCERLEAEHPGWMVSWMDANPIRGWERPAGWYAARADVSLQGGDTLRRLPEDGVPRDPAVFGETTDELKVRIAEMDERIAAQAREREALMRWAQSRPRSDHSY
jgi:hypothetical protein